jgi:uncharacterized coiled-coil protein SlyX
MSTSLDVQPSGSISKSEYLSSLPRWRRWLSKFNWHPVVEIEIRAIEREKRMQELEQRSIVREKRVQQIESDISQIESEISRLDELNAKIAALWPSSNSSSAPTTPPEGDSQI